MNVGFGSPWLSFRVFLGCLMLMVTGLCAFAAPSGALVPINTFSVAPSTTQAGGHPDIETEFTFGNRDTQNFPSNCFCQDPENIRVGLPTGLIGNPTATPQCTAVDFGDKDCSPDSQVGVMRIDLFASYFYVPVFNLVPHAGQAGLFGFDIPLVSTPAFMVFSARTGGDYGLDVTLEGVEHVVPPEGVSLDLWGIPDSQAHESERFPTTGESCEHLSTPGGFPCFAPTPAHSPPLPLIDGPTSCSGPLNASLEIVAYDSGVTTASTSYPGATGCDQLSFNPSLYAQPTTSDADSPSGLEVDLSVPQEISPTVPSPSEIRATTVTLPEGFSINPNAADGKTACLNVEARFGSEEEAQCPEYSKIGTLSVESPALPGPLPGYIYIGQPEAGDRYRIFLTANGFATHIKLAGSVEPDSQTGQLVVSFQDLPQTTIASLNMHFFGSERGLLATPTRCGTYPVKSTFTPWDSLLPSQTSTQFFSITSGPGGTSCPGATRAFAPGFAASSADSTAAVHAPFSIELSRADGDQNLSSLNVTTPPGLLATLKGIPYCPDAALTAAAEPSYSGLAEEASPSCPAASQIGVSVTGAGAGDHPVYLPGEVYLAGPYDGSPLSLAVITPAVSGPYDLGNVVVRAALRVNPETIQISAVSDPLPRILEGILLRLRSIRVDLNRPEFTINPTNCDPLSVGAEVLGSEGAVAHPVVPYQVANCGVLPFKPKLSIELSGSPKRAGNPALTATLTASPGEANIARAQVSLPSGELLDQGNIKKTCTKPVLLAGDCPQNSIYGEVRAWTPLLEKPLEGPVYLVGGYGYKLPALVAELNGQIRVLLHAKVDTDKEGGIRNTFELVPDAAVSKFILKLDGGHKSLLENGENICKEPQHATVNLTAQSGKEERFTTLLKASCRKKHAKRKHDHKHSGGRR